MDEEKVAIAFINSCWGVKGEVIAEPLTGFTRRFEQLKFVHISGNGMERDLTVTRTTKHGNRIVIKFKEINDRDEASQLRNSYLQINRSETYALPAGNYYIFDLIGLEVIDSRNQTIGTIVDIWEYPANDIVVVKSEKGRLLIPCIKEVIKGIDLGNRRMEVELLPGMEFEAE